VNTQKTVVLVGATGRFGARIATALLASRGAHLRIVTRDAANPKLRPLLDAGATIASAELANAGALDSALRDADVVVSALNGGPDVIVDGQERLLRASERIGVRRFIPSDYSLDYSALDEGDNVFLDLRRRFALMLDASAVAATHVLVGAFTEVQLSPRMGIFDLASGVATPWGNGDEAVDMTTLDDAARVVAQLAVDDAAPLRIAFAGDSTSVRALATTFEQVTGRPLRIEPRGSAADLAAWIARARASAKSPMEFVFGQYQLAQINGKGKLRTLDNARFPDIVPTTAADVLRGVLERRSE
jgi:nucleoside-diphosphate-sugar epimerase